MLVTVIRNVSMTGEQVVLEVWNKVLLFISYGAAALDLDRASP
jgi:hypothetical protein